MLNVASGLFLEDGVLTGSGTVVGNVSVSGQSEIDVLTVSVIDGISKVGNLLIQGNLMMKRRNPALDPTDSELLHATVTLGLLDVASVKNYSSLRVTGRIFVELMSISCVISCNRYV